MFEIVQAIQAAQQSAPQILDSALPTLESGIGAVRQSVLRLAPVGKTVMNHGIAMGQDVGVDSLINKVDPSRGLTTDTLALDGSAGPQFKEELSNLTHAANEGYEAREARKRRDFKEPDLLIQPVPRDGIVPWSRVEPPKMKER